MKVDQGIIIPTKRIKDFEALGISEKSQIVAHELPPEAGMLLVSNDDGGYQLFQAPENSRLFQVDWVFQPASDSSEN